MAISILTALGSHATVFPGDSHTWSSSRSQNQTKPITLAVNSGCDASVQSVLGGAQTTHHSAGGLTPSNRNPLCESSSNFLGVPCQHCLLDIGCDFQILGEPGSFVPVCSACVILCGKQGSQLSSRMHSPTARHRACISHGCYHQCACYEEEFLSLNLSIKEALPSIPTSQQVGVLQVLEATQTFCSRCLSGTLAQAPPMTAPSISGPKFFPVDFEEEGQSGFLGTEAAAFSVLTGSQLSARGPSQCKSHRTRRRRHRARRQLSSSSTTLDLWRRVENLLPKTSQDELETTVLQLERLLPETQVESLPRWTLDQLLSFVSEDCSVGKGAIKFAVQDVIHRLETQPAKCVLHFRCSNVTQCRPAIVSWLKTCSEDVIALQETHLCGAPLREFVRKITASGYRVFDREALPTEGRHSKGGLALLCRNHLATRDVGTFLLEGCGYVAAEMRTGNTNLLLVSIYLQNATPASHFPNADILAALLLLLEKWQGPWCVMGDFNLTPLEIAEAGLPVLTKGVVVPPPGPSMDNGNTIDMVLVSRDLAGVTTVQADPTAPHRPHLSLVISVDIDVAKIGVLQIKQWPEHWGGSPLEGLCGSQKLKCPSSAGWMSHSPTVSPLWDLQPFPSSFLPYWEMRQKAEV